ncbi:MAG: zinc ribbon domain-containing protein [Candidatus Lokiarchaeota archaeon]|nr:zinc ribbon domain-containing protein [Candidatus Lokiarchaeota archaeon]
MSDNEFYRLWNEFGRNMHLIAILTILTIVTGITGFVAIIFLFISLGNIKLINSKLKSLYLYDFRKKMVSSFIIKIISICLLAVGIVGIVFSTYFWFETGPIDYAALVVNIILSSSPALIGLILFIVGFSIEMKAWGNLKSYLVENRALFPEHIASEIIDGAEKLRIAALMYALGFLGITLIIGFILQIIGFFKLAKFSNVPSVGYVKAPRTPAAPQAPEAPYPSPVTINSNLNRVVGVRPKFCPNCGAEVLEGGSFCPDCGSSIS